MRTNTTTLMITLFGFAGCGSRLNMMELYLSYVHLDEDCISSLQPSRSRDVSAS